MQYLVGSPTTAEFSEKMGIATAEYIMGLDPGLSLALGSVPLNLVNMTQAYGTFAQQGELNQNTTVIEIRDRNGRIVYTREDDAPEPTQPMTPAEAYLTHYIIEGNTDESRNILWGDRANLFTVDGARRPAGFKTGTTNDFKDVSGFGYVPESLVTGVWMGNNNQEPMSNVLGQGLFSADGPLFLWNEFMTRALNEPWAWNDQTPVGQTSFDQPQGIVNAEVCRWTGLAASGSCGRTITLPFLEGTVPRVDNVHRGGCLDFDLYLSQATPTRPPNWFEAAETWANRVVNGQTGAAGDPGNYQEDDRVRFRISPIYGESSFPSVCGVLLEPTPGPSPTRGPDPSDGPRPTEPPGGGGGGGGGGGPPTPSPPGDDD
jgi:membrane peptidoglycan carboxypeptidase